MTEYVSSCIQLSMLLEVSAFPKPGNVHRTRDFSDMKYVNFLGAISGLGKFWGNAAEKGILLSKVERLPRGGLGRVIRGAASAMLEWQRDGNTSLGTILLLVPLSVSAAKTLYEGRLSPEELRRNLRVVVDESTYMDSIELYKALREVSPGGMGEVPYLDFRKKESIREIKHRNISLREIFEASSGYDSIAREWTSNFEITFKIGYPFFKRVYDESEDLNAAIVDTYLKILSTIPDTLIIRKAGREAAMRVSKKAEEVLEKGGSVSEEGGTMVWRFEEELGRSDGLLNPGTTADLTCSSISIAVLEGLRP